MTEEELKQEAEEWVRTKHNIIKDCLSACVRTEYKNEIRAYLASAEPREKRIAELTEWLNEASDEKLKLQMLRVDLVSKIGNQEKHIAELEKENAKLKDGIALKDEEVGCIETDFNTFKSKAKEIIKNLMKFAEIDCREYEGAYKEAEQFVKE